MSSKIESLKAQITLPYSFRGWVNFPNSEKSLYYQLWIENIKEMINEELAIVGKSYIDGDIEAAEYHKGRVKCLNNQIDDLTSQLEKVQASA